MAKFYIGRNIHEDKYGYYIVFSDKDLTSSHDKKYAKNHHATYEKALSYMKHLIDTGSTWFDAHFDPTI
ncbi:MAG TPA: hypothetical protein VNG51_19230 [Ktedonobacteraceae bacterium]|nr:hypothetical protein [Ktedonobacteraceae bacterium]